MTEPEYKTYLHNPPHLIVPEATYMLTGATYSKARLFDSESLLEMLVKVLQQQLPRRGWELKAYVALPNHYHVLAVAPSGPVRLAELVRAVHRESSLRLGAESSARPERVWYNYWDTCINGERSYCARVNYIHFNPVKHGYVAEPGQWRFSSFQDFVGDAPETAARFVREHPFDRVSVEDDF